MGTWRPNGDTPDPRPDFYRFSWISTSLGWIISDCSAQLNPKGPSKALLRRVSTKSYNECFCVHPRTLACEFTSVNIMSRSIFFEITLLLFPVNSGQSDPFWMPLGTLWPPKWSLAILSSTCFAPFSSLLLLGRVLVFKTDPKMGGGLPHKLPTLEELQGSQKTFISKVDRELSGVHQYGQGPES